MTRNEFLKAYKYRGYLHFDRPFTSASSAWKYVQRFRADRLTPRHGFLPFIGFTLSNLKISREKREGVPHKQRKIVYRTKKRDIKIASHKDAAIYTYYGKTLSLIYERRLARLNIKSVATAFRSLPGGKCNIDHAKEVFDFIQENSPCVALAFDVEKFFDTLSHKYLRERWADLLEMPHLPPDHYQV